MVQDECIVMINSKAHMCKCCAFQNSWKKQMRASHLTHLRERLMMKVLTSEEWAGRGCCSSLPCPGRPMTCRVFNSLLCTLAVWVACSDGHACAQRGQRRTLFALSYPSLLHFPDTESLSEAKAKQRPANPSAPPCYVLPIGRVTDAGQPWAPSWIVGAGICTCDLMISS